MLLNANLATEAKETFMQPRRITSVLIGAITVLPLLAVPRVAAAQETTQPNMESRMPSDIDPQSGFRLPLPKREDMDETGQRAYDRAATSKRSIVGLRGPGGIALYSPKTIESRNAYNEYLRFEVFPPNIREVAILTVAREMNSQFEWAAHEPQGLKEGVPQEVIDVIKYRKSTQGLDETYAAIIELGRQTFGDHKVTSECFARIKKLFPPGKLVELVMLMGNYSATAALLTAFDMQLPEGQKPLLPMP
jgi:4-carboxymuconolactone decarboxylase